MTLTVEVSDQTMEELRQEAATAGVTVEAIVRERLDDWNPTPEELEAIVAPGLKGPVVALEAGFFQSVLDEVLREEGIRPECV
ncbi:hypothetical protein BH11ARM2_BH11ARM2_34170 [soil metagenome]